LGEDRSKLRADGDRQKGDRADWEKQSNTGQRQSRTVCKQIRRGKGVRNLANGPENEYISCTFVTWLIFNQQRLKI
jgi:hypothetical protein